MSVKSFEIQSVETTYQGFFKTEKVLFKHSLYQGGSTKLIERELLCRGEAVVVLLFDSSAKKVVLVEQCRPGALFHAQNSNQTEKAWLLEPVAGMIDHGETAIEAGIREAHEEAGVTPETLEYVCEFYPSPGACDEIIHLYAADIQIEQVCDFAGLDGEHEDIKVIKLDFDQAKQMLLNAEFKVATTYIALQWLFFQKLNNEY